MAYPVIMFVPDEAAAPSFAAPELRVVETGRADPALDDDVPARLTWRIELAVDAIDARLEEFLDELAVLARSAGGVLLVGRGRELVGAVSQERAAGDAVEAPEDDPGPVWEHLPGVGLTSTPSAASWIVPDPIAVDAAIASVADDGPSAPTALSTWDCWLAGMAELSSTNTGRVLMYLVPLLAAVAAMWAGTDSAMQIATTAVIFIAELGIIAVLVPRRALQFGAVAAIMFLLVLVALVGALESWMGTLVSLAAVVFAATPGLVWAGRSAPVALDQGVRMVGRRIFGIIGVLVAQGLLVLPVVVPISIMAGRSLGRGDVGFAAIQSVAALGAVVTSAMFAVIVREEIRMEAERVDAGARPATT